MENLLDMLNGYPPTNITIDTTLTEKGFVYYIGDVRCITSPPITRAIVSSPGFTGLSQNDKARVIIGNLKAMLPQ